MTVPNPCNVGDLKALFRKGQEPVLVELRRITVAESVSFSVIGIVRLDQLLVKEKRVRNMNDIEFNELIHA